MRGGGGGKGRTGGRRGKGGGENEREVRRTSELMDKPSVCNPHP